QGFAVIPVEPGAGTADGQDAPHSSPPSQSSQRYICSNRFSPSTNKGSQKILVPAAVCRDREERFDLLLSRIEDRNTPFLGPQQIQPGAQGCPEHLGHVPAVAELTRESCD